MIGLLIMGAGTVAIVVSTAFEIKTREPAYAIIMKLAPLAFAYGVLLWQVG